MVRLFHRDPSSKHWDPVLSICGNADQRTRWFPGVTKSEKGTLFIASIESIGIWKGSLLQCVDQISRSLLFFVSFAPDWQQDTTVISRSHRRIRHRDRSSRWCTAIAILLFKLWERAGNSTRISRPSLDIDNVSGISPLILVSFCLTAPSASATVFSYWKIQRESHAKICCNSSLLRIIRQSMITWNWNGKILLEYI